MNGSFVIGQHMTGEIEYVPADYPRHMGEVPFMRLAMFGEKHDDPLHQFP